MNAKDSGPYDPVISTPRHISLHGEISYFSSISKHSRSTLRQVLSPLIPSPCPLIFLPENPAHAQTDQTNRPQFTGDEFSYNVNEFPNPEKNEEEPCERPKTFS